MDTPPGTGTGGHDARADRPMASGTHPRRELASRHAAPPERGTLDPGSTTATAVAEDSGEILLEGSGASLPSPIARGGGDEPLEAARGPAAAVGGGLSDAFFLATSGTDRGRRFPLGRTRMSIGRAMDNDIVLADIAVSRKHLVIEFDGTSYVLTDLGSGNGTLVNGRDEDGTYRMVDGDRIELGNTMLVFECPSMSMPAMAHGAAPKGWGKNEEDELSTVAGRKSPRAGGVAALPPPALGRPPAVLEEPLGLRELPRSPPLAAPPLAALPLAAAQVAPISLGVDPYKGGPTRAPAPLSAMPSLPPPVGLREPLTGPAGGLASTTGGGTLASSTSGSPPGYRPYPPQVAYPSAGSYSAPGGLTGASRLQYPNGVLVPAQGEDKRKVLIGILAVTLLVALAGITIALMRSEDARTQVASETTAATTPATATATPLNATSPTATPLNATSTTPPTATPPAAAPLNATSTTPPTATPPAAAPPAATPPAAAPEVTLASLMTGTRSLPPSTFGTDETAIALVEAAAVQPAPEVEPPSPTPERAVVDRRPERPKRAVRSDPRDDDEGVDDDKAAGPDIDGVLDEAAELYGDTKFSEAATLLRKAARGAGRKDASRLSSIASGYDKVGSALAQARSGDAPSQMRHYKNALRADEVSGDGLHQEFIRSKLAQTAPRAAGSYMAAKKFAEARAACDDAERYGSTDPGVQRVRDSLERKALSMANQAAALAGQGKDAEAATLAADVLKIVPRSSPAYAKAAPLARE